MICNIILKNKPVLICVDRIITCDYELKNIMPNQYQNYPYEFIRHKIVDQMLNNTYFVFQQNLSILVINNNSSYEITDFQGNIKTLKNLVEFKDNSSYDSTELENDVQTSFRLQF